MVKQIYQKIVLTQSFEYFIRESSSNGLKEEQQALKVTSEGVWMPNRLVHEMEKRGVP